jgi:hypothetical protein
MEVLKITGMSLATDFSPEDLPNTIAYALMYRSRINSFDELPKNKRPPRNLWDKPFRLSEFFDEMFHREDNDEDESKSYIDINSEDVE